MLAATGALASHFAPPSVALDVAALEARCGPERHSLFVEEWSIRDFFDDKRCGVFVDVGANHYEHFSNTYYVDIVTVLHAGPREGHDACADAMTPVTRFPRAATAGRLESCAATRVPPLR